MHCVILNGSLVPNLKFSTNDDGRLCISLRELAEAYDTNTEFDDVAHLLTVPTIYGECIYIPTKGALHNISEYFEISNSDKHLSLQTAIHVNFGKTHLHWQMTMIW